MNILINLAVAVFCGFMVGINVGLRPKNWKTWATVHGTLAFLNALFVADKLAGKW